MREKYIVFSFFLLFFFSLPTIVNAATGLTDISESVSGDHIVVSATVAVSQEFIYAIQKNSRVFLNKDTFALDEEGEIRVHIRGGEGKPLKNHQITIRIVNAHNKEISFFRGKTDIFGEARFQLRFHREFLGKNSILVTENTYDEPLVLFQKMRFIVYETSDAREQAIKKGKNGVTLATVITETPFFSSPIISDDDFYRENATMKIVRFVSEISRASPS